MHQTWHSGYLEWGGLTQSHMTFNHVITEYHVISSKKRPTSSSTRPITRKHGRVLLKGEFLIISSIRYDTFFKWSHEVKRHIENVGFIPPENFWPTNFEESRLMERDPRLSLITTWLQYHMENEKVWWKFRFFLQDYRTTKRGWENTYNKIWCHQIMLSTPQRLSATGSCF